MSVNMTSEFGEEHVAYGFVYIHMHCGVRVRACLCMRACVHANYMCMLSNRGTLWCTRACMLVYACVRACELHMHALQQRVTVVYACVL